MASNQEKLNTMSEKADSEMTKENSQVDGEEHEQGEEYDQSESEGTDDGEEQAGEQDIVQDDILKPSSTRSKIVINLENVDKKNPDIKFKLDPYDKVRMQLYLPNQKFYKKFQETIYQLENVHTMHPLSRKQNLCRSCVGYFVCGVILLFTFILFFLITQLTIYNIVIIAGLFKLYKQIYIFLMAYRKKRDVDHRTKNFVDFIEQQNFSVYDEMKIEIQYDSEGRWLAFNLKEDNKMFEKEIAERRTLAHKTNSLGAVDEMKQILKEYSREKGIRIEEEQKNEKEQVANKQ